jgi:hypothetical protein
MVELFRQAGEGDIDLSEMHTLADVDKSPARASLRK